MVHRQRLAGACTADQLAGLAYAGAAACATAYAFSLYRQDPQHAGQPFRSDCYGGFLWASSCFDRHISMFSWVLKERRKQSNGEALSEEYALALQGNAKLLNPEVSTVHPV